MTAATMSTILCVVLMFAGLGEAATRKQCKSSVCAPQITACRTDCLSIPKRGKRAKCRAKCKSRVTRACRAGRQACGDTDGGPDGPGGGPGSGGQCQAYTSACPARSLLPLREPNAACTGAVGAGQPCDVDFATRFRVKSPWRTHAGECCVIDTCRGATASGIYDNLASPGLGIPPGSSLTTAPVIVTIQSLSSYFQRAPTPTGLKGQWGHHTATIFSILCATPPQARVISTAGGPLTAVDRGDFLSYDTRPVPPPTGSWDFLTLSPDETSVSLTPPQPPLLPACGSAPNTLECQPHLFDLQNINFPGERNPITAIVSERISLDKLCDDSVFASAEGTFRRRDGSQCSVTIHAHAQLTCATTDDCAPSEACVTNDPNSPTDFGNAFPGWSGQSCTP